MKKKITYLFGAGASANAIPIVANMNVRMTEILGFLKFILNKYSRDDHDYNLNLLNHNIRERLSVLSEICDNLEWLINEAGKFYTIDTLAKKFYLSNQYQQLARLKKILITYFTIEQILCIPSHKKEDYSFTKNTIDKRYGSFIAAISHKRYQVAGPDPNGFAENLEFGISKNVKILSWNYDMQFELTLKMFLNTINIKIIKN